MNAIRQSVIDIAKEYLGTPYHHQGRVKGAGIDCAQFLIAVFVEAGLLDPIDVGYYPSDWMLHRSEERYLANLLKYCDEVDYPLAGDIVMFKFGRCFSHSGIVIDYPTIIHAHRNDNCCYADVTKGDLLGRERKYFALKGIDK